MSVITDRQVCATLKQAEAYAAKFEKKYRFQFPLTTIQKAMDGSVYYVFTSRLPKARG